MAEKDKQFLSIEVERELLDRIDSYRFARKFYTRAEAVRYLLDYALKKDPDPEKE